MKNKIAYTLLELIIAVSIIGILSAIALGRYTKALERAKDNEARTNLRLIQAAEEIYKAEHGSYIAQNAEGGIHNGSDNTDEKLINTNLKLRLPTAITLNWDYWITTASGGFTASAYRGVGYIRTATITDYAGSCPGVCCSSCP